jgi:PAS domain-containing protein
MDGGVSAGLRGVCRSIAFVFFMATSAYLLLELVIALSAQGEPTGAVAPFTGGEIIYPNWYQAPEFQDALRIAILAYPAAAIVYGIGMVAGLIGRLAPREHPRMAAASPSSETRPVADETPPPVAETLDAVCVVSANRRIQHIAASTARLFGLTPRDMLGRSLEVFLAPLDLPKLDALVAAAYADSPRAFTATIGILLPEAAILPVDITCRAAMRDAGGSPGATVLTMRPVAERGQLDDRLAALWY